jgi:ribosomal protein S18 acetylase RimI-like enzyme
LVRRIIKETSLSSEQLSDIRDLFVLSNKHDKTSYVFDDENDFAKDGDINNFLLYNEQTLLSCITVFAPKTTEAEIIAITKPEYRREGYFKSLLSELILELIKRKIYSILFVCDHNSLHGNGTVQNLGADYEYSEYLMNFTARKIINNNFDSKVRVKKAVPKDFDRLLSINIKSFGNTEEKAAEILNENFRSAQRNLYSIFFEDYVVGMIGVYSETERNYIYGFCIDVKFRARGIGRKALSSLVELTLEEDNTKDICLEVLTDNINALGLYKDIGFELLTEFKYYRKSIKL